MTGQQARLVLNAARDGADVSERAITRALEQTGDFNRNTWAHVAALNLVADHEAGIPVDPLKLDAAMRLIERTKA